ncbi:MAG: FTR1 family protein, partial [Prevotella sp.]|nr:FTR1 family protein [Prevotella sp.]
MRLVEKNRHIPLLGPAVSMIGGIVLMNFCSVAWPLLPLLAAAVVLTFLFFRWPVVQTFFLMIDFLLVGMLIVQRQPPSIVPSQQAEVVVVSEPVEKPKTISVELLLPETGQRVRRYIQKDARRRALQLGHALVVSKIGDG